MLRRVTLALLSMVLLLPGLTATAQDEVVIRFRSWSPVIATTEAMIEAFNAENPNILIEPNITNYTEYLVDLQTMAAGGALPDLIGLEPGALTQQYRDQLMPMQDCAVSTWGEDWEAQFYPVGIEQARLGNPEGDDNIYGLPVLTQTINMWYTVPIFEEAGVGPPATYDELLELADMFNAQGIAPVMIGAGDGWIRRDVYMQLIHNIAPGLIYQAEDGEASFTDEPFVEAMTWWKRLFDDGIFQTGALGMSHYPAAVEQIQGGRAAMFPMGAWWQQQAANPNPPPLDQNLQGYAPFKFPDVTGMGAPEDLLGGIDVMLGVTRASANPEAACKVITDWISGAGAQALINTYNDLPAYIGLRPESFGSANQEAVWDLFTEDWLATVKYARQLKSPDVKQALEDALSGVAAGEMTPAEGMQMVQDATM
ncbi:MAG: extracellular solute-binding protein [Chloroflexi bacterium]|nr:extracellular solute-binding protein [Chloroflexota bacterium]MCY4246470.1 extracellular solute-binding protein [Chloroflexota bacterium]